MIVLWILLAIIIAAMVALFQYDFLFSKNRNKRKPWFALLRFFTVLTLLLLLIVPQFESSRYETELPHLSVLVDDSQSMEFLEIGKRVEEDLALLQSDQELADNYQISFFEFSETIEVLDTIDFSGKNTNLYQAMKAAQELYRDQSHGIIILSDGNQNKGTSYQYLDFNPDTKLYPVVYGDTTRYADIKISQLNTNRFSYLNNEFPIEVVVEYQGEDAVSQLLQVNEGNQTLFSKELQFSESERSQIVNFNIKSTKVGLKSLRANISKLENEKNISNNQREFAVEVIDQQTKVAIISNYSHPDLGALKKAIESNEQRTAQIKSFDDRGDLNEFDLVIIYGVDADFPVIINELETLEKNLWLILGPEPALNLLNRSLTEFSIETGSEVDRVQPVINSGFSSFNLDEFSYSDYPPVEAPFGSLSNQIPIEVVMNRQIGNLITEQPLWFTYENNGRRHSVSLLNGLWRWRTQSYLENRDYKNFDDLIGAHIQYLASGKKRDRLSIDVQSVYEQNNNIKLRATYLDKNYEFDSKAILNIVLVSISNNEKIVRPFIASSTNYVVNLNGIESGDYSYIVKVQNSPLSVSGFFKVLDYNVEKMVSNASSRQFQEVVGVNNVYYGNQFKKLIVDLKNGAALKPVERRINDYFGLIDFEYLLFLLFVLLGVEWFSRKYNGLI
jgi:hypothetical protein